MPKETPMTPEAASRIQPQADRSGRNQAFKARAQRAAAKKAAPSKGEPTSEGPAKK